jgi:predicted nucleic acid-binding protein
LEKLGNGEGDAIALAMMYFPEVVLLMDETKGREESRAPENQLL